MTTSQYETRTEYLARIAPVYAEYRAQGRNILDAIGMTDPGEDEDDARYAAERLNQEPVEGERRQASPDAPASTPEERIARIVAFAEGLGRRAEINDMDHGLIRDAATWVRAYTGSFDFLTDLKVKGCKSAGQAKGVVNCIRADIARGGTGAPAQAPQSAPEAPAAPQAPAHRTNRYDGICRYCGGKVPAGTGSLDKDPTGRWVTAHIGDCPARSEAEASVPGGAGLGLADVPEGHYAIESSGANDLAFYRIDRPTEGAYAGRVFVKMIVGGHPDQNVKAAAVPGILARIEAAGIAASAALYGTELGRCCRCNRTLTDETSRALGIGPECRTKGGF